MPYIPPANGSKIIIVGGGAFGLSTAYALALKKYDVRVFERRPIPSADAASTDINKAVRMEYGDKTIYQNLMIETLPMWREWNKERAAQGLSPVYHETGLLCFSKGGKYSPSDALSMKNIRQAGYGHVIEEFSSSEAIGERFPGFKDAVANQYDAAYFNNQGGWCDSSEAIKHLYSKCVDNGVHFIVGPKAGAFDKLHSDPEHPGRILGIQTHDGLIHEADRVVLATGSWTPSLIDMKGTLTATGHMTIQFKLSEAELQLFKGHPVWCADVAQTGFYGFPPNAEGYIKVANHLNSYLNPRQDGISVPRTHVTHTEDTVPLNGLLQFRRFLAEFFPFTDKKDALNPRVCWYCDSQDGNFLVAPHPDYENLIVASGDSGHGMKFLPSIGFKIGQIIEGVDSEFRNAWAWRESKSIDLKHDGFLGENDARMATADELKA